MSDKEKVIGEEVEVVATVCGSRVDWCQPAAGNLRDREPLMTVAQRDAKLAELSEQKANWVNWAKESDAKLAGVVEALKLLFQSDLPLRPESWTSDYAEWLERNP